MSLKNISVGTLVRTGCLVLALANQLLAACGKSPLPFTDAQLTEAVSGALTAVAALVAWWKNNSFTRAAVMADGVLHILRAEDVNTVGVSVAIDDGADILTK